MVFRKLKSFTTITAMILLSACASKFPTPAQDLFIPGTDAYEEPNGAQLFEKTFKRHGGEELNELRNVNVGITGRWKRLIRRIQPLVTDYTYRVDSQERILPLKRIYAAQYTGPAGNKSVYRAPSKINVHYNNNASSNLDVLSSTALTADAFHLFLLGPLALSEWRTQFKRLSNKNLNRKPHYRIYLKRVPGFGYADDDEVVLWINQQTLLTSMVQITLRGHKTTKAAHVETEFLDYIEVDNYTFPLKFFERVNAPIAIDAHAWELTGIDINRSYDVADLLNPGFSGAAQRPAEFNQSDVTSNKQNGSL